MKSPEEQLAREYWDKRAAELSDDQWKSMVLLGPDEVADYRDRKEKALFARLIGLKKDMTVLDVGCGTGRWGVSLAGHCRAMVGFDLSPALLDVARRRLNAANVHNVTLVCSPITEFSCVEKFVSDSQGAYS